MRPLKAFIDLTALRHNLALVKKNAPESRCVAVIKAQAYGHQMVPVAKALAGQVDAFAVSSLDEAIYLRESGIEQPILLLEGVFSDQEMPLVIQQRLWLVVHTHSQLDWLQTLFNRQDVDCSGLKVWLKVNTGMNRLGFSPREVGPIFQRLIACVGAQNCVLMSHFASADEPENPFSHQQYALLHSILPSSDLSVSLCNSAGILRSDLAKADWVRPGIMLYGVEPWVGACPELKPVMRLVSQVIALRDLAAGESVGYGQTWKAQQSTLMAVVACGYADGYPRHVKGAQVAIAGQLFPIIGRISMDMLCVDISAASSDIALGEAVELFGSQVCVAQLAAQADTIAYEILCNIHERVERVFLS